MPVLSVPGSVHAPATSRMPAALLRLVLGAIIVALTLWASPIIAAPVRTAHVEAELVSDRAAVQPGKTTTIAVRLKMERGWHTYWQNPGESGLPTSIVWKLPA